MSASAHRLVGIGGELVAAGEAFGLQQRVDLRRRARKPFGPASAIFMPKRFAPSIQELAMLKRVSPRKAILRPAQRRRADRPSARPSARPP